MTKTRRRPGRRWTAAVLGLAVTAVAVSGAVAGGPGPQLAGPRTGDEVLAAAAEPQLTGVRDRVSICVWDEGTTTVAGFGADERTRYEIGSVTKTFTGVLLAAAVARGEVALDDELGRYVELGSAPVAAVTLAELAGHTSGLGEWGDDARDETAARVWTEDVRGSTVHTADPAELLDRAAADRLESRGEYRYSNIGYALLGQALAEAAGTDYPTLLTQRVLNPVGMADTGLGRPEDLNPARGYRSSGRGAPPWRLGAYAPSGGAYSTATDLCRYAGSLLNAAAANPETTSGAAAAQPVPPVLARITPGERFGWNLTAAGGRQRLTKTGRTGGFSAQIAIDPQAQRAVVAVGNSAEGFEALMAALL